MKSSSTGYISLLFVAALCCAYTTPSGAEPETKLEKGRLQICKIANSPQSQTDIEIPVDGKYVIPAAKIGVTESIIITQTDFSSNADAASQAQSNSALHDRFKLENRDGKMFVRLDTKSASCVYLNAEAPVLARHDLTLSGTHVAPDWIPGAEGTNADGVSYQYFNGIDQTYYVASEVGRNLSFAVHDMQTGSNLNRDKIKKVAVTNAAVLSLVPSALKASLARNNQYDTNLVDLAKYDVNFQDFDLHSSADITALVTKLTNELHPLPHSRLILALPVKGQVKLKFTNTTLYGNKLEGMGFYRDSTLHMIFDSDRGDYVPIGAFINFQVAIIDIDSAKLVTSQAYADGRMVFRPPVPEIDLVDTITDKSKFVALSGVVSEGVDRVIAAMFVTK